MTVITYFRHQAISLCAGLIILIFISSCSSIKKASPNKQETFKHNYCMPSVPYLHTRELFKEKESVDLIKRHIPVSAHDQLLCHLLGISGYVNELWTLKKDSLNHNMTKYLFLKQKISSRLLLAQSEINSVAAELDCEGERSDMAAHYLDGINGKRNTNFTVGALVVGAVTTVVTAIVKNNNVQNTIAITGGLAGAGLGAMTINPKGKKVEYLHDRNLLKSIWKDPASNADYPDFVWKMLHEKSFSNTGNSSLAQSIRDRWLKFGFDGKIDADQEALLFGTGGYYRADELHIRSSMTNQLQSTIRSMQQDLSSLVAFVATL